MDEVQVLIPSDEESWKGRCYERVKRVKAQESLWSRRNEEDAPPPSQLQEELVDVKEELRKAVQISKNMNEFVDVLEHLSSEKKLVLSAIVDQVTPTGDSLLHEAVYFGETDIVELIGHHFPELVTKTNIKGDTPLHVAARAKRSDVIILLLSQYDVLGEDNKKEEVIPTKIKEDKVILRRMTNEYGNTALHEAVCSNHLDGVKLLFKEDQTMAYYLNKSDKSPLNLAILNANKEIVDVLLKAPLPNNITRTCMGNSPLHAALRQRNLVLIKEILEKRPNLMYLRVVEDGGTPLHYAAYMGYVEGVRILLAKSASSALEWNKKGQLPIHLACKGGHLEVVKQFLKQKRIDGPRVFVTKKGQNILHVTAKNGRHNVVNYILRNTKLDVNEKDKKGNTALHLASKSRFPSILWSLTRDKRTKPNEVNNDRFTAKDILHIWRSELETPESAESQATVLSELVLDSVGAHESDHFFTDSPIWRPTNLDWLNNSCNSMMIVAVLIATVTFAAGFTVPGGVYGPDNPDPHKRGVAVLGERWMFQIFVISNTLAMYSSSIGCFLVFTAQYNEIYLAMRYFNIGYHMVGGSLLAMFLSFMAAVHLVWPALLAITIVGIISFSFILGFFMLSVYPLIICPRLLYKSILF